MQYIIGTILQVLIAVLLAPLSFGIIKKIKAYTQKRKGAPVFQLYFDIIKLMKKDTVTSDTASWIFKATPFIVFGTAVTAFIFVPVSTGINLPSFAGDVFLVVYILAMGKFFLALSGMDTGSTFGGMGSSREMMISSLVEPGLIVSVMTLGLLSGTSTLSGMFKNSESIGIKILQPSYMLIFISVFIVLLAETARTPVDDPATHLELTMVHEAMILEYSGKQLAFLEWGAAIKQLLFITILANVFIPVSLPLKGAALAAALLLLYVLKVVLLSALIGIVETATVKLRLFSVPNLAAISFIAALLGFVQHFVFGGM